MKIILHFVEYVAIIFNCKFYLRLGWHDASKSRRGQKIMKIFMLHVFRHGVFALKRPYRIYQCDHGGEIN